MSHIIWKFIKGRLGMTIEKQETTDEAGKMKLTYTKEGNLAALSIASTTISKTIQISRKAD